MGLTFAIFLSPGKSPSLNKAQKLGNNGVLSSSKKCNTILQFTSSLPEALLHLSDLQAVSNSFKVRSW